MLTKPLGKSYINTWLSRLAPETNRTYICNLKDFAGFLGSDDYEDALAQFIGLDRAKARNVLEDYRRHLKGRYKTATINHRLSTISSLINACRSAGITDIDLDIQGELTDDAEPACRLTHNSLAALIETAKADHRPHTRARNVALVKILAELGAKGQDIRALKIKDWRRETRTLEIAGELMTVSDDLAGWLDELQRLRAARDDAPLFSRVGRDEALTSAGLYGIIRQIGDLAGIDVTPVALRQSGNELQRLRKENALLRARVVVLESELAGSAS